MIAPCDGLIDEDTLVRMAAAQGRPAASLLDGWLADAAFLEELLAGRARCEHPIDWVPLVRTTADWLDGVPAGALCAIARRLPQEMAQLCGEEQREILVLLSRHLQAIASDMRDMRRRLPTRAAGLAA